MSKHFMINAHDFERSAEIVTAVSHPMRLLIMHQLVQKGPLNVSQLQHLSQLPQPTVSQHLSKLKSLKVVSYNRKGLEVYYKVTDAQVIRAVKTLSL
ncbi:TPA: ArsR/SmtB family transcription factor [Bacillus cereus]